MNKIILILSSLILSGCLGMPKNVQPVTGFELDRYLGKWYEIARLDHSFERGLSKVTAEYTLKSDGGVSVINRGFSESNNEWKEAEGKAYFVNENTSAYLKVSFFGPFYGSYIVFDLDQQNYQYAFVSGPDTDYLWLLSRTPNVNPKIMTNFIDKASKLGFNTDNLIYVKH